MYVCSHKPAMTEIVLCNDRARRRGSVAFLPVSIRLEGSPYARHGLSLPQSQLIPLFLVLAQGLRLGSRRERF
jgi:hypothetical protein